MMTEGQAAQLCVQFGAQFVQRKGAIDWWRLPNGEWFAVKAVAGGMREVRRLPANACGC